MRRAENYCSNENTLGIGDLWLSGYITNTFLCLTLYFTFGTSTMKHRSIQCLLSVVLMNNVRYNKDATIFASVTV